MGALPLVVGVTSHRHISPDEIESIRRCVREFLRGLQRDFPQRPLLILSPLAEGGDQWVADEGLALGARLVAPLPMPREQYAHDFHDVDTLGEFSRLCARAQIVDVSALPGFVSPGPPSRGGNRDLLYAQAGIYVSNHCHILIAIWDGQDSDHLGGTAQIAHYHLTGIKPAQVATMHPARRRLGHPNHQMLYHISCSRQRPQAARAAGSAPRPPDARWRIGEHTTPGNEPMPATFRARLDLASEFAQEQHKYMSRNSTHPGLSENRDGTASTAGESQVERLFRSADWLAIHFQQRVVSSLRALYTLAALMAIAFAAYDNLPAQDDMIYVFLLLFALGGFIALLANRRGWHRKYLDYRALAEGLRIQFHWRRAGLSLIDDDGFAHGSFPQKADAELDWVRDVMRCADVEDDASASPAAIATIDDVIRQWIGDARHPGQLDYYERKVAQRARTHRMTERIGSVSLVIGIGISIVLALFTHQMTANLKNDLIVVMAVFSVVAGVRSAYAYKKADKELIQQYRSIHRHFLEAQKAIRLARSIDEKREVLRLLGEAALAEQVEWVSMQRQRPLEHNRI